MKFVLLPLVVALTLSACGGGGAQVVEPTPFVAMVRV